jgi:L-glutamine:2-deoxy-scyllo-inosose/3-amino-2,3-dideoxy-scyllo-inosose aminotransferase
MSHDKLAIRGGTPVRTTPFTAWPIYGEEEKRALIDTLESGIWSHVGPRDLQFSKDFAAFQGARHGISVANGSVSLELALRALKIGPGDEVIVPALTWLATGWAPLQTGAKPIFADVKESDWCLDPKSVEALITPRTKAIIPVHLYNQMAPMDELMTLAARHSLAVIEDCAHAHGFEWNGQGAGTIGDIGSFSFQGSKTLTAGEGSLLLTNDDRLAELLSGLRNCGRPMTPDSAPTFGSNYRITEFQAAILQAQFARLPDQLAHKAKNLRYFRQQMESIKGIRMTPQNPNITKQGFYAASMDYNAEEFGGVPRDVFVQAMEAEGIPITVPYDTVYKAYLWKGGVDLIPHAKHEDPAEMLGIHSHCPVSEKISGKTGIKLLHNIFLGDESDVDSIVEAFAKVSANAGQLRMQAMKSIAKTKVKSLLKSFRSGS